MKEELITWGIECSTLWYWLPTHIHDERYLPDAEVHYWGWGCFFIFRMVENVDTNEDNEFTA